MTTAERLSRETRAGFTLVEVLVAMVILAIGLMGLQALTIGAIRGVHLGQKNSEYAAVGTRFVEAGVDSIRRGDISGSSARQEVATIGGVRVEREIVDEGGGLHRVVVVVFPTAERTAVDPDSLRLQSSAYFTP